MGAEDVIEVLGTAFKVQRGFLPVEEPPATGSHGCVQASRYALHGDDKSRSEREPGVIILEA